MEVLRRRLMPNTEVEIDKDDYSKEYLTFTAVGDGTFTFTSVHGETNSLSYSLDEGITWTTLASGAASPTVQAGNKILWKGLNLNIGTSTAPYFGIGTFSSTCVFDAFGNVMSLYYGDEFENKPLLKNIFFKLFSRSKIRNAHSISLPATTLAEDCYHYIFENCTSLTTAPTLPATTLANGCYSYMFSGCTSLTIAPKLPATTLTLMCYFSMFSGCTSLTTAPELPATTLANYCYYRIFENCTSLTTAPELPATTLYDGCYNGMFYDCTSLTTAPTLPAKTLTNGCYSSMFYGCTSLTTAPTLPAKTLTNGCYSYMFSGCTSLTIAPKLPATTLAANCYRQMFSGCTKLTYIKAMFTTTPSSSYTQYWVSNVAASGTFVKNSAATWNVIGVYGIPSGWTVQTYTNRLPSDYVELEYISSTLTGSQYIDLNINLYATANNTYDLATKFKFKGYGSDSSTQATIFGCQKDVNPWPGTFIRRTNNDVVGRYIGGSNKDNTIGHKNDIIELPVQTSPNKNVYTSVGSSTHDWGTSLFCYFSDSNNTPARYAEMDLYYFKLWLNGTLVRDMVPCVKTSGQDSGTVGLYDLVNNVFYTSPNGAAFVAGPIV